MFGINIMVFEKLFSYFICGNYFNASGFGVLLFKILILLEQGPGLLNHESNAHDSSSSGRMNVLEE